MGRRASAPAFERSDVEELSSAVQELSGQIGVLLQAVDELREAITWVTQNSRVVILPETPESPETATSRVRESVVCDVINLNEQPSEMTLPPSVVSANIEQETISAQHGGHAPQESPSRQLSSAVQKQLFSESSADSTSGIVRLSDPEPDSLPDEATPSQIERALNQLAEALDAGHSEQLTAYLRTLARFHTYSFCNILLISLQRPDATFVAGFHAWKKKFRRSVRRGEKGIAILAPVVRGQKRLADPDEADDDDPEEEHSPSTRSGIPVAYRTVYVFDVSQTDGESLPPFPAATGTSAVSLERVQHIIEAKGISVKFEPLHGGVQGQSSGGEIVVSSGLSPAESLRTLVHEWAHEELHRGPRRAETTKKIRETEAEAVAFVVCTAVGIDMNSTSSDYIRMYQGDRTTLAESLQHIRRCAGEILNEFLRPPAEKQGHNHCAAEDDQADCS